MNKLTEQNPKVGLTIKWQMSKWKTTDRIETHHSNLESSRTIVFWCYWLTTNNITALLTNQGQSLTIYNSLWCSVTVINSPFHDYTLSYSSTVDYDQHDSCIWAKRLLTIYNKILTKASAHVRESGFWNRWNFCLWNLESWALESGIQLKESGILLRIGIQSKVPLEKTGIKCLEKTGIKCLESGIHGVESRIQDCLGFPNMRRKAAHVKNYCLRIY